MFKFRVNLRKLSVWIIFTLQLLVISSYFFLQTKDREPQKSSVSFLISTINKTDNKTTYHTLLSKIILNTVNTRHLFEDFNSSLCYRNGTDIKLMRRSHNSWKCECLPGYHSTDCGQPEVIWRALLAYRKPIPLKGPRKNERRIIYLFEVSEITKTITDIRINELNNTIDLFVLYEVGTNFIESQLNYGFLKHFHKKILYLRVSKESKAWFLARNTLKGLKSDDMIIISGYNEIPNLSALQYFKIYDNWPEPISFRLRWSVYGFFWIHPNKTNLITEAFTVKYLYETLNNDFTLIKSNKTRTSFNIGDLNHFGGWFCEFCNDPSKIIDELNINPSGNLHVFRNLNKKTIDSNYVEELIENGVYIDGKTELLRAHRFREAYFAPQFLTENSWKYDYLMINIYSKMDYYE